MPRAPMDRSTALARARRRALPVRPDLVDVLWQGFERAADPDELARDLHFMGVGTPAVAKAFEALTYYGLLTSQPATGWRNDLATALHVRWQR